MKILIIVFLVLFIISVFILFFPIKIKGKAHFDILDNIGAYSFMVGPILILCGRMYFSKSGDLKIENKDQKFQKNQKQKDMFPAVMGEMIQRIDFFFIDTYVSTGFVDNPVATALTGGFVEAFFSSLFSVLKTKNTEGSFRKHISVSFEKNALDLSFDFAVGVSVFDMVLSSIAASKKIKMKKELSK